MFKYYIVQKWCSMDTNLLRVLVLAQFEILYFMNIYYHNTIATHGHSWVWQYRIIHIVSLRHNGTLFFSQLCSCSGDWWSQIQGEGDCGCWEQYNIWDSILCKSGTWSHLDLQGRTSPWHAQVIPWLGLVIRSHKMLFVQQGKTSHPL